MKPCMDQIKLNNGKISCGNAWCKYLYNYDTDCSIKEELAKQTNKKRRYVE